MLAYYYHYKIVLKYHSTVPLCIYWLCFNKCLQENINVLTEPSLIPETLHSCLLITWLQKLFHTFKCFQRFHVSINTCQCPQRHTVFDHVVSIFLLNMDTFQKQLQNHHSTPGASVHKYCIKLRKGKGWRIMILTYW